MANITSNGIFGDTRSDDGLLVGLPMDPISESNSNLKVYYEGFKNPVVDAGGDEGIAEMEDVGWAENDINTATAHVYSASKDNGYLLINAGTKADSGTQIQANVVSTADKIGDAHQTCGPITSTTTLMDGRELIFKTRIRVLIGASEPFNSKFALGWMVTDTSIMTNTTGALALGTGGGIGFHCNGDSGTAVLQTFIQNTSGAASFEDTGVSFAEGGSHDLADGVWGEWIDLGFRAKWDDADAPTGRCDWYVNGTKVRTVLNSNPMQATQAYSVSYALHNGPTAANQVDMAVDHILTAVTVLGR